MCVERSRESGVGGLGPKDLPGPRGLERGYFRVWRFRGASGRPC